MNTVCSFSTGLKINSSVHADFDGTCHSVQHWGSLHFFQLFLAKNGGLLERGISYFRLLPNRLITVCDSLLVFGLFVVFVGCTKQNKTNITKYL